MAEPLSASASIIAVVGFAAESSKLIFCFFQGITHAPANIHDSALALSSLYVTLTNLQKSGTKLDPNYKFPAHFCGRLNDCLKDLKGFEAKIGKIDAVFSNQGTRKHDWDTITRRSWERVEWLLVGEQETRRFLDKVKMYQNEFILELLGLLIIINGSPISSMTLPEPVVGTSTGAESSSSPILTRRISQPLQSPESLTTGAPLLPIPSAATGHSIQGCFTTEPPRECKVATDGLGSLPTTAGIRKPVGTMRYIDSPRSVGHCGKSGQYVSLGVPRACFLSPSIRVAFTYRWNVFFCGFVIRVGPAMAPNWTRDQKAHHSAHYRNIGVGLGLSLNLPKRCRRKLDLAFYPVQLSPHFRTRLTVQCDIDFPRIIPGSAEIVQRVKEGSVDIVQRLIGAGKATSKDTTIHGTTLLHLASRTSNLQLIWLLIQEGGDVNAQDEDGETPLHCAMAREGNYHVARLLIENGSDLTNNTVDQSTPLHTYFNDTVAKVLSRDHWIEDTLSNSQGMSIAHFLAWSSKSTSELFEKAVRHTSAGLWSVDGFGRTSLHLAASRGNLDILGYLLERASLSEVRRADNEGRTAIHYTVQNPRLEAVDMLLAAGGELSVKDNSARTVLHHAARWGNLEAAKKVMALGDSEVLLSPDKNGNMPSHLACGLTAIPLRNFLLSLEAAASLRKEANPMWVDATSGIAGKALVHGACSAQCPSPTCLPMASQKKGGRHKAMLETKKFWHLWVAAVSVLLLYFLY